MAKYTYEYIMCYKEAFMLGAAFGFIVAMVMMRKHLKKESFSKLFSKA